MKDASEQTNVSISPSSADLYTYPPQDDYEDPYSTTANQQNNNQQSLLQKSPNARQINQPLQLPQQNSSNQNSLQLNNVNTNSYQRLHANNLNDNNSNESPPRKTVQINSTPASRGSIRKTNQNSESNINSNYQAPLSTKRGTFRN